MRVSSVLPDNGLAVQLARAVRLGFLHPAIALVVIQRARGVAA